MTVISYPIPPFQNLPIHPEFYKPRFFFIQDISLGIQTTVTTTNNHDYVIGQLCRLIIPSLCGSRGLDNQTGFVVSIPSPNQVTLDVSSLGVDPFKTSALGQQPQILAIGDTNNGAINANGPKRQQTYIDGSFINISPR